VVAIIGVAAYLFFTPPTLPTTPVTPKVWRWSTGDPGSAGYRATSWATYILSQEMPSYQAITLPYSGTTAAIKGCCKGEAETCWSSVFGMMLLHTASEPFKDFKPQKIPTASWFATGTVIHFLTTPEKAKEIRSWRDLEGRNVYLGPSGYVNHYMLRFAFEKIGLHVNHIEMSTGMVAEALRKGTIDATMMYDVTGLPTWGQELDISLDIVAINPSEKEIEELRKAGFEIGKMSAKVYSQDVGTDVIYGLYDPWGYWTTLDIPEDAVYNMLKAFEKRIKDFKDPIYDHIREVGFVALQREGVEAIVKYNVKYNVNILIHPGLAKYLREKGAWDPQWDKYIATTK